MKTVAIIPSRYGSTRFEGKPLASICGKPMIQHVCEAAQRAERIEHPMRTAQEPTALRRRRRSLICPLMMW